MGSESIVQTEYTTCSPTRRVVLDVYFDAYKDRKSGGDSSASDVKKLVCDGCGASHTSSAPRPSPVYPTHAAHLVLNND